MKSITTVTILSVCIVSCASKSTTNSNNGMFCYDQFSDMQAEINSVYDSGYQTIIGINRDDDINNAESESIKKANNKVISAAILGHPQAIQ